MVHGHILKKWVESGLKNLGEMVLIETPKNVQLMYVVHL